MLLFALCLDLAVENLSRNRLAHTSITSKYYEVFMITQSQLKKQLHYSPETGVFTWLISKGRLCKAGDVAGSLSSGKPNACGYIKIMISGKSYGAHRLAYLYVTGCFPKNETDHLNGNKSDNRFINLRCVTRQENLKNKSKYKCNKSGFIGVGWHKRDKVWVASIRLNKKLIHLGNFKNLSDAVKVRIDAELSHGFHINHGR